LGKADESIFPSKTGNLKQAIEIYLEHFNKETDFKDIRLDLISVDIDKNRKLAKIRHYSGIA
jgi:Holliday junction resolvase-like predicted endonuclease